MLDKLKTDFDEILELVKKCPNALQETALKTILGQWFSANVAPPPLAPAPAVTFERLAANWRVQGPSRPRRRRSHLAERLPVVVKCENWRGSSSAPKIFRYSAAFGKVVRSLWENGSA